MLQSKIIITDDEVMLNVLRCQLTYYGQAETNAEAWFNVAFRPRKPEGSLGRTAQDGHSTLTQLLNYVVIIIIIHSFYIALFSALEQTR